MSQIESTKYLKDYLQKYFTSFFSPNGEKTKTAWCSSVGPSEILIAMGYKVYYPENHGALLGATRASSDFIPVANAIGYSPDCCSYLSSDIGSYLNKSTPLTKVYGIPHPPKPDVLVYSTNQCHEVQDWFNFYAKEFNVPCFGIHPPWKLQDISTEQLQYVKSQFQELIGKLEKINNKKLDLEILKNVVAQSAETSKLWNNFLKLSTHSPSPFTFFDSCIQMAPAVVLRGTPEANDYYRLLNQEINLKIKNNESAVQNEKIRLYWDGMPIWGQLRYMSDLFANNNTCIVASTYCNSWVFDFDPTDPLMSMAHSYTQIFINRADDKKEEIIAQLANQYKIDGIIFHDSKTCPYNSNTRFGLPQRLATKYKIPYLIVDGDLNDLRCFSKEQSTTSIESFIEQLKENKVK